MADLAVKRIAERLIHAGLDDLTFRQLSIFLIVATEEGPHRVRDMAERLDIQRPVVTRALSALAQRGWITRHIDQRDARDRLFTVTRSGASTLAMMKGWGEI